MIDADRFKSVNHRHGHAGGDAVLKAFAATVTRCLRPSDLLGRRGGEEVAVLLAEADIAGAAVAAERIRAAIACSAVGLDGQDIRFTVSLGAATLVDDTGATEDAPARADAALCRAEEAGRNRVVIAEPAPAGPRQVGVGSPARTRFAVP